MSLCGSGGRACLPRLPTLSQGPAAPYGGGAFALGMSLSDFFRGVFGLRGERRWAPSLPPFPPLANPFGALIPLPPGRLVAPPRLNVWRLLLLLRRRLSPFKGFTGPAGHGERRGGAGRGQLLLLLLLGGCMSFVARLDRRAEGPEPRPSLALAVGAPSGGTVANSPSRLLG